MSYDFRLGQSCPHLTIDEVVRIGSDRKTLPLRQPIANTNKIRITANDIEIPRSGLYSSAGLKGTISGPFRILKGSNLLEVENRQGSVTVLLSEGSRIPVETVVREISTALSTFGSKISVTSESGHIVFSEGFEKGPSSFLKLSGSALSAVGFSLQRSAKGKEVYPPWQLDEEEQNVVVQNGQVKPFAARFPMFVRPLSSNPILKVSYVTFRERCLRCLRTGVENDYRLDSSGNPVIVRNEDLLYQASLKAILTKKGSNPYHPQYGSLLMTRLGTKANSLTTTTMNLDVQGALRFLQNLQTGQAKYQIVTPRERLDSISSIQVVQSENDPTKFGIKVVIFNSSDQPVVLNFVFAVPGSIALTNSRGQSLGAFGSVATLSSITI